MENDNSLGLIILLGLVAIGLFGGVKGLTNNGLISPGVRTPEQKQIDNDYKIQQTQAKIDALQIQVQAEEDKKNASVYKGEVTLYYANRSTDPNQEYLTIRFGGTSSKPILLTGWKVKSLSTRNGIAIPKGTYLFFTGMVNSEDPIYLNTGETLYLVTGVSPNGASFKTNKCSGYLQQFQTFVPYITSTCPVLRNENLSSIPKSPNNDACLEYINNFPNCRIQTDPLPQNWSYECTNFISTKINYPSCVNIHKNDKDFYQNEWRVYLKRNQPLWKVSKETIVLYDDAGKVVDTLKY